MTTGKSPAELFFANRPFRTKLGNFNDSMKDDDEVRDHDRKQKEKAKRAADNKVYVKPYDNVQLRDQVLVKIPKTNKLTPQYDPIPYTVIGRKGSMITSRRTHPFHTVTRNISHFKKLKYTLEFDEYSEIGDIIDNTSVENSQVRRSERTRRAPIRYPDM